MASRPTPPRSRRAGRVVRPVAAALLLVAAAACGSSEAAGPPPPSGTVGGVGELPERLSDMFVDDPGSASTVVRATVPVERGGDTIGDQVDGNRVIVLGDSLMASISRRYGGELCARLEPLGWAVEVDAETGRFVDFGNRVLDRRLDPGSVDWDAAVVFLGNNYRGDPDAYRDELDEILTRLAPRPTLLLTVTEHRADRAEVNEVVESMLRFHRHVEVLDWATMTADHPELLSGDGLHLSDQGRVWLSYVVSEELGEAPGAGDGECLSTSFSDDSAGSPSGSGSGGDSDDGGGSGGGSGSGNGSGGSGSGGATPTTRPDRTTAPPTSDATPPTSNNPTLPPATDPPHTDPPHTEPPAITIPATDPPATVPTPDPPVPTVAPDAGGDPTEDVTPTTGAG